MQSPSQPLSVTVAHQSPERLPAVGFQRTVPEGSGAASHAPHMTFAVFPRKTDTLPMFWTKDKAQEGQVA